MDVDIPQFYSPHVSTKKTLLQQNTTNWMIVLIWYFGINVREDCTQGRCQFLPDTHVARSRALPVRDIRLRPDQLCCSVWNIACPTRLPTNNKYTDNSAAFLICRTNTGFVLGSRNPFLYFFHTLTMVVLNPNSDWRRITDMPAGLQQGL
jgi:hypothetical protein